MRWQNLVDGWDLIPTLHHHNKCTTLPYMRVCPTHWAPPSCEGVLCTCCVGVVNLTFFISRSCALKSTCPPDPPHPSFPRSAQLKEETFTLRKEDSSEARRTNVRKVYY
jgi:hypothetical protein